MQIPSNKNASENARALLSYLNSISGHKIITGQHTQTIPMEEIEYIKEVTRMRPKLYGFEMLSYSPNINYDDASSACLTEVYENRDTLDVAFNVAWGKRNQDEKYIFDKENDTVITFSFHWYSPLYGRDKSFYAEHTTFDPSLVLMEGTKEREAFFSDLDEIAKHLQRFADADIPVLWRPFHESDGTWFWWGSKGPEVARDLYILMYDYYTKKYNFNNLLWVWNCRLKEGYPGDEYVDVISVDIYLKEHEKTDYANDYKKLLDETTKNKVCALAEIGYLPDISILSKTKIPWAYYMCWSKEFCIGEAYNSKSSLQEIYQSDYTVKFSV